MIENLSDIEALVLRCRTDEAKQYISEAILSYSAGAYRSAIVSTWIAVVFDLIDKIKEIALTGDAKAIVQKRKYDEYIRQIEAGNGNGEKSASSYESKILILCRDEIELLDKQQYMDLERLREDRCRCAHPSFEMSHGGPYKPSAEQARVHIRNAITYVLSQPPIQGKAALEKLTNVVKSEYFPINASKAEEQLKETEFKNANTPLINSFIDALLFGYIDKSNSLFSKKRVIAAINGSLRIYPVQGNKHVTLRLNKIVTDAKDDYFIQVTLLSLFIENAWSILNNPNKEKIYSYIKRGKLDEVSKIFENLAKIEELQSKVMKRIASLSFEELEEAVENGYLRTLIIEEVIIRLPKLTDWNDVNKLIKRFIFRLWDQWTKQDLKRVLDLAQKTSTRLDQAFEFESLVSRVRVLNLFTDDELCQAIGEVKFNQLFKDEA